MSVYRELRSEWRSFHRLLKESLENAASEAFESKHKPGRLKHFYHEHLTIDFHNPHKQCVIESQVLKIKYHTDRGVTTAKHINCDTPSNLPPRSPILDDLIDSADGFSREITGEPLPNWRHLRAQAEDYQDLWYRYTTEAELYDICAALVEDEHKRAVAAAYGVDFFDKQEDLFTPSRTNYKYVTDDPALTKLINHNGYSLHYADNDIFVINPEERWGSHDTYVVGEDETGDYFVHIVSSRKLKGYDIEREDIFDALGFDKKLSSKEVSHIDIDQETRLQLLGRLAVSKVGGRNEAINILTPPVSDFEESIAESIITEYIETEYPEWFTDKFEIDVRVGNENQHTVSNTTQYVVTDGGHPSPRILYQGESKQEEIGLLKEFVGIDDLFDTVNTRKIAKSLENIIEQDLQSALIESDYHDRLDERWVESKKSTIDNLTSFGFQLGENIVSIERGDVHPDWDNEGKVALRVCLPERTELTLGRDDVDEMTLPISPGVYQFYHIPNNARNIEEPWA